MNNDELHDLRHSLAHLLGAAVTTLFPNAKNTIGPAIEHGFYYDFDMGDTKITEDDLPALETKMREILKEWSTFTKIEVSEREAREHFKDNPYKLELIDEIVANGTPITLYTSGTFTDLCRGGHIEDTKTINPKAFKLDRIAGAYWRGDESNKMLTRIYGLAFNTPDELTVYLTLQEEAKKRDHRKLGKEMELFSFSDYVGTGLPLWLPYGTIIIEELERLAKESEFQAGYERVRTPHLAKEEMYLTSGHLPYYEESMYPAMQYEGGKYYLKAMNCPHHHQIFAAQPRTYKELPLRLAEYGTCYRHEKSGELFGLMRVRSLQMNDAHIYCTEDQFADEFRAVNELYLKYFKIFGIEKYVMRLSLHDPKKLGQKYVNEPELWKKTEAMVRQVLIDSAIPFVEVQDEAAFYGPKIDVQVWSAIGREFTLATNQVDFAVPARFNLSYIDRDGKEKTPLCIHRAPLGTHERFTGFLIEHFGGNFPLWLSPVQIAIVPVQENHEDYANTVAQMLKSAMVRTKVYTGNESLGKRIHKAKQYKPFYVLVIGDKEVASNTYSLENRTGEKITSSHDTLIQTLLPLITNRQ